MRFPLSSRFVSRAETVLWAVVLAGFAAMLVFFVVFAGYMLAGLGRALFAGRFVVTDFFAQWSFARFAWEGHGALIYDPAAVHAYQLRLAPDLRQYFPYPYPPSFLLYIAIFGAVGFPAALSAWMAGTFALYLVALWPRESGWLARALVVLAPAVASNLVYGQNGFLTAALLVGGFRLLPARPILAGVAFGLLSFKPQFGVLVPVALLAAGHWRAIGAAAATVAGLVVVSGVAFGWHVWGEWFTYLPAHANYLDATVNSYRKPTLQGALLLAGAGAGTARAVPFAVLAMAVPAVWWCFRVGSPLAVAVLVAGTFAGAPYGFLYDLPAVTAAAAMLLVARPQSGWRLVDDAVVALALAVPAIMTLTSRFYWTGGVAMVLLFALSFARAAPWRARS